MNFTQKNDIKARAIVISKAMAVYLIIRKCMSIQNTVIQANLYFAVIVMREYAR